MTIQSVDNDWLTEESFARLQQGDDEVFRLIYDQYVGLIQYVVRRCGIDTGSSDDIVQETFLRLFRCAAEIQKPAAVKSWLVTTARHLALDDRRRCRHLVASADENTMAEIDNGVESAQRELEVDLVGDLVKEIARETGDSTFSDFYVQGRSAKDIAADKGEAISTVTTRLSRVRNRFKERLRVHIQHLRDDLPQ